MNEVVTLLTSVSGHALVKSFSGPDVIQQPFSTGKLFNVSEERVSDLKSLSALLLRLKDDPTHTIIRGSLVDSKNINCSLPSVARPVPGSRIISVGSSSPVLPLARCLEDLDATALLKAKSDGTITVDTPAPASNKPDRLGYGLTAPSLN